MCYYVINILRLMLSSKTTRCPFKSQISLFSSQSEHDDLLQYVWRTPILRVCCRSWALQIRRAIFKPDNWALLGVPPFHLSNQQVLTGNPNTSSLRILSSFTHLEHTRPCSSASTRSCCCSRRSPSRRTPRTSWWRCCSNTEEWRLNTCLCPEDPGRAPGQLWQKTQRTWGSGSVCHHTSCVIHQCFVTPQSAHAQVAVTSGLLSGSTSQSTRLYSHFFGLQYSMQESRL